VHADKQPEPLNLGVPVVYFPRAIAFLARAQALLCVRDCRYRRASAENPTAGISGSLAVARNSELNLFTWNDNIQSFGS
jgi:hypothetical protein